jgi:aldehyde dehydrogenase (NAD+)
VHTTFTPLIPRLKSVYQGLTIGDPFDAQTLWSALIDGAAFHGMERTSAARAAMDRRAARTESRHPRAYYVRPAIVEMPGRRKSSATKRLRQLCTS